MMETMMAMDWVMVMISCHDDGDAWDVWNGIDETDRRPYLSIDDDDAAYLMDWIWNDCLQPRLVVLALPMQ